MVSGQNRFSRENHPQVQRRAQLDHRRGAVADHQGGHFQGPSNDVRWLIYGYYMVIIWLIMVNNNLVGG